MAEPNNIIGFPQLISRQMALKLVGMSINTFNKKAESLPYSLKGRERFYNIEDLKTLMDSLKVKPCQPTEKKIGKTTVTISQSIKMGSPIGLKAALEQTKSY